MKKLSALAPYFAAVAIVTVVIGLIYVTVQQSYRSGANDPQLQVARDIHDRLTRGASIQKYLDDSIDLEKNLGVFTTLYDKKNRPLRSSGFLYGKFPQLPGGVFDYARINGEHSVTWQPRPGIRMATVILNAGLPGVAYIVVGRSLQEVEMRENNLLLSAFICWVITIGIVALTAMIHGISQMKQDSVILK